VEQNIAPDSFWATNREKKEGWQKRLLEEHKNIEHEEEVSHHNATRDKPFYIKQLRLTHFPTFEQMSILSPDEREIQAAIPESHPE